ncbi:MAG: ribonuclease M5 [Bacilli bacterium]|nr:ribonuclease M5 [Bacilli bacterium]
MIVVVEGVHDASRLLAIFPHLQVLTTNGSAISFEFLEALKRLSLDHTIVCCLDPDHPGERIRKIIMEAIPTAQHVFAPKKAAISRSKRKVGIEHMSKEAILSLFDTIQIPQEAQKETLSLETFNYLGLSGRSDSASKRRNLGEGLKIGYANAKTMRRRLNLFGYNEKDVKEFL